jgi:ERCC4-type nuclease
MEITEKQYFEAIQMVIQYTEQIKKKTEIILKKTGITKTPKELYFNWRENFPNMSVRLFNILYCAFTHKKLCDITKKEFLSVRGAGLKHWTELHELTNNNK